MAGFGSFAPSSNVEDRRDEDYSSVKWANVPHTLHDMAVSVGNQMWGTPQVPEAPDSPLSDALGKRDMKIEPKIGRSLLHRAIDDTQNAFNMFGVGKGDSWADKLTAQGSFSKGFGSLASAPATPPNPVLAGRQPGAPSGTTLDPGQEAFFRQWLQHNNVPFNPDATAPQDYDMRGFYQGLQQQNPKAVSAVDPNDSRLHYPDFWKTPSHATLSNESQWAPAGAPQWTDNDQLAQAGRVLFDDRRGTGLQLPQAGMLPSYYGGN